MGAFKSGCAIVLAFVGTLVLIVFLSVFFGLLQLPLMNINREVTTHSQQYIQTKQTMLLDFYSDFQSGDPAHQAAAKTEICAQSALLEPQFWPQQVVPFINLNCH